VSKNSVTLKTRLGVVQGHWKQRCSIDHIQLSIGPSLWLILILIIKLL